MLKDPLLAQQNNIFIANKNKEKTIYKKHLISPNANKKSKVYDL